MYGLIDKAREVVAAIEASIRRGEYVSDEVRLAGEALLAEIEVPDVEEKNPRDERFHNGETYG